MEAKSSIERDYKLWVLLEQTTHSILEAREIELRTYGITPMQAAILFIIKAIEGPATPAEIARWLYREHHTASGILNRMEREGLITKTKGHVRKNMIRVELTEKGEEAYIRSKELKSIHNVMSHLSDRQKDNFVKNLETLRNSAVKELEAKRSEKVFPFP